MNIVKEFAKEAIKNGHGSGTLCEGWDWIRENLHKLDHITRTEEYQKSQPYEYIRMAILTKGIELTKSERDAIKTAWYLTVERDRKEEKELYKNKMIKEGWTPLTEEVVRKAFVEKKKLKISASMSCDWMSAKIDNIYKAFVSQDNKCFLMKPKQRTRGYYLHRFENAFCKII